ncbi:17340_t:CDS:2 [Dentiscutata erythropus]|uniref:17340_t:CDS:1 n=1 Tax=Dentiscutata erythropus TaxID=1348616 RepID=A0A9N9JHX5_9GLOM|nr:17340_t:CDS:2 [Dentiscutata erythropus]
MNYLYTKLSLSYFGALLASSVCGTQYLFSAYSTALASKLNFSSVQINTIGSATNFGCYLSGPIFGYIIDHHGPRRTAMISSFFIFAGYFCLAMTYGEIFNSKSFLLCALYLLTVGIASSAAYNSVLGLVARNFTKNRGIAFGFPVALYGLSAFLFAQVNGLYFNNDTYHFLIFLAIACGLSILIGGWFLVVIPRNKLIAEANQISDLPESSSSSDQSNEQTPLIDNKISDEPDIGGLELFYNSDALLLGTLMFLLGGCGLMYINNVGEIIKSLYSLPSSEPSHQNDGINSFADIQELQNLHVSLLSISSCFGRIFVGFFSDITKQMFNLRRISFFILSGCLLSFGHFLTGFWIKSLDFLYPATIFVGTGFGMMFSIAPTITNEWFGPKRFGINW